jgi:hypothetical protein
MTSRVRTLFLDIHLGRQILSAYFLLINQVRDSIKHSQGFLNISKGDMTSYNSSAPESDKINHERTGSNEIIRSMTPTPGKK